MPVAQPNTAHILDKLACSLEAGELLLSDIEKQRLLREVRALPIRYQSLALEGIIVLLDGKIERGINSLEQALSLCPTDPVTWGNYASVLNKAGLYSRVRDVIIRSSSYDFPGMATHALHFGAVWADREILKMGYEKLEKYAQFDPLKDASSLGRLQILEKLSDQDSHSIKEVADVMMLVLESEHLLAKSSNVLNDGEGYMSFSVAISMDDPKRLSYLNDRVIDAMIDRGLEMGNTLAFFEAAN